MASTAGSVKILLFASARSAIPHEPDSLDIPIPKSDATVASVREALEALGRSEYPELVVRRAYLVTNPFTHR